IVFVLRCRPSLMPTQLLLSRRTLDPFHFHSPCNYVSLPPSCLRSQSIRLNVSIRCECPTPPANAGLGSSRFARRYSGNRSFFLFLWILRCFSSPGVLR